MGKTTQKLKDQSYLGAHQSLLRNDLLESQLEKCQAYSLYIKSWTYIIIMSVCTLLYLGW